MSTNASLRVLRRLFAATFVLGIAHTAIAQPLLVPGDEHVEPRVHRNGREVLANDLPLVFDVSHAERPGSLIGAGRNLLCHQQDRLWIAVAAGMIDDRRPVAERALRVGRLSRRPVIVRQ